MWPNPQETAHLITFTEEILNGKLNFCAVLAFEMEYWEEQKQLFKGVLRKMCSENMQQIYWRTPMPKCDFNKSCFALHFY